MTKQDAMWNLIDFYTRSDVLQVSQNSKLDKINPKTVAKYIGNHLETPKAFDKLTKVMMRYNQHKSLSDSFVSEMLKELNIH